MRVISWDYVFIMSTISIFINLLLVIFFFKEPKRDEEIKFNGIIKDYALLIWTMFTSIIIFVVLFSIFLFIIETFIVFLLKERLSFKFVDITGQAIYQGS